MPYIIVTSANDEMDHIASSSQIVSVKSLMV